MKEDAQFRSNRLAVLIDAENTSAELVEPLLKEVAKYGTAHVKRIYGDWTSNYLAKWKDKLHEFAIQPIQQFRYTTGKNSTDSALIIDAMDLLYTKNFDGFCIVSSDSDFTRLAGRLRESGLIVYGFGRKITPEAWVRACDKFIYTEILGQDANATDGHSSDGHSSDGNFKKTDKLTTKTSANDTETNHQKLRTNRELVKLLKDAYEAIADEDEWTHLGPIGTQLTKLSPSFDPRNYGYKKLSDLVHDTNLFEIRKTSKSIQIKLKT